MMLERLSITVTLDHLELQQLPVEAAAAFRAVQPPSSRLLEPMLQCM
jgi:hypothetical protein